jgi:hypothetical protein
VTCYVAVTKENRNAFPFGMQTLDSFRIYRLQIPFSQAKIAAKPISHMFLFEGSNQLTNLDLQHNGFELTCALRFASARQIIVFLTTADRASSSAAG